MTTRHPQAFLSPSTPSLRLCSSRIELDGPRGNVATEAVRRLLGELGFEGTSGGTDGSAYCAVCLGNGLFGATALGGLRRSKAVDVASRMVERGGGTMVLLTDATEVSAAGVDPETSSRQAADVRWWQHLAARVAPHGVRLNTIKVGYAPFLGHALPQEREASLFAHQIVRRPVVEADLRAALQLLLSRGPATMVGEVLPLDGGLETTLVSAAPPGSVRADPSTTPPDEGWSMAGRTVLVAGASSGIGAETALELARRGADLVLAARREPELESVAEAARDHFGTRVWTVPADLADLGAASRLTERAFAAAGQVHDLVYTAGVLVRDDPRTDTAVARERAYRVNVLAYADLAECCTARWVRDRHRGSIVGVSSSSAEISLVPGLYSYSSSKAAMEHLSLHLAVSFARHRIRVNAVVPGFVDTPMAATADPAFVSASMSRVPVGRPSATTDLAAAIAYLTSPASTMVSGARLRVCGGLATLGPLPAATAPASTRQDAGPALPTRVRPSLP